SARLKVRFLPEKNEHLPEGEYSGKVVINRLDANDRGFIKPILLNVDIVVRKGLDGLNVTDFDGDGIDDIDDQFPSDISESVDSDMDGVGDNSDAFPHDDSESLDTDGDGVGDNSDAFPRDESETTDSDGDGVGDNSDDFPNDPTKSDIAEIQMVLNSYQLMQTDFSTFSESSGERMFFYIPNTPDVIVPSNIDNVSDGFIETTHTPDTFSKIQVNMRGSDGGQYTITLRVSRSAFGSSSVITDARDSGDATLFVEYHHEDNPTIPDLVLTGEIQVELQGYDNTTFIKQLTIELSIDSQVHHIGEWSRNYSKDTESGDSSVYFYIPKQPSVVYSDSDEPEDRRWGEERSYTSIVAHLMNEQGELQDVTLRGYKNMYGNKAMNEGMQKGHGQFKLSFFSEDNPNIAPNTYLTGKIKVLGQGWHEPDFMVTSWVDVTIDTAEEVRINETNTVVFSTESSNVESSLFFLQAKNQVSGNGPQVGIWSGEEKSSFVTFDVTEQHEQRAYPLTLRMGKRGCYLFEMNNGVYCSVSDLESLKVEYVPSDNEHLPSGHYVGSYYIQERNWFDSSDSRAIKVSVDVLVENKMIDSDGDGVVDSEDIFPDDPSESKDADDDGVGDNSDVFPHNALESMDSDGDGVGDNYDQFPLDSSESIDSDNDGIGDNQDEFSNVAGSYTYYTFSNAPSSFNHVQFSTEVMEAPGAAGKVFWSNQFRVEGSEQGGYTGLQSTGSLDRKIFLFSLWNTSEFRNSEDGGVCKPFDHEGSGTSCSITYDWSEGTQYLFDITFDSGWLNVSVTNAETKESFDIGSIKTDASGVSSAGMASWTEFWGGGNCYDQPKVTAKFDVPKVDDDQTTATVSSVSPSSYCSDMTSIELLGDASIQRNYINNSGIGYVQHQSGMLKAESLTNDAMVSVVPRSMTLPMTAIKVNNPVTNKEFCLDARNGSTEDGTIAQVYSCNGTAAQKWGFDEETQLLINKKANKCLTSTDSGMLAIYDCNLSDNQKWTYTENRLIHTGTELCLSVEPEISLGAATSLQSCYSQEESQLWKMNRYPIVEATWVYGADKAFHIGKNQCLEADSLSGSVTINACNGSSIQSWLYDEGRLFHSSSNKCLEYKNESSVLTIGECNDQDSQIWALP
ncbi:ricin-type beta-trefoil lectin domain protein, partial [Vibrio mediterranei]|uniref:ricin-type beta-trefoil lectin domain protein n=1 Tax=Vibrio mediterranei TaxID=689 RepID=UPI00148D2EA4